MACGNNKDLESIRTIAEMTFPEWVAELSQKRQDE